MINSPRTLEACTRLGIVPDELYQISFEDFKELNPDVRHLSQDMAKFRYDAEEKFRISSIDEVKEEREKIIQEEEEKNKDNENNTEDKSKKRNDNIKEKVEKVKEEEKKKY